MLPFTREELDFAVSEGRVYARRHPTLPLTIYNYSDEVAFGGWWNEVTLTCRGLILNDNFEVVAMPWKKFFNMGQRDNEIEFHAPVEVTDKLDGSLGILYKERPGIKGGYSIATRGSFESDQAQAATFMWKFRYTDLEPMLDALDGFTFLFEIIYPENRIVVNYHGMKDLVLLGAVNHKYGYYLGPKEAQGTFGYTGPVAEVFDFKDFGDALANWPHREGKEGVVVRSGTKMVKLKQPDYLELHKLVTNATPLNVWRQLRDGHNGFAIVSNFPDEFHDYIWDMVQPLEKAYDARRDEILAGYSVALDTVQRSGGSSRKDYAKVFSKHKDKKYYFLLLDNKPLRTVLWTELRPREAPHEQSETQGSETHHA